MQRAGFTPACSYQLVHSYCTQLLMQGGGDISAVQKVRGHRDVRTTLVYTQVVVDPRIPGVVTRAFAQRSTQPVTDRVAEARGNSHK
jgi:site-specific recombinase XerD